MKPGLTPKGTPMPQTVEEYKYLLDLIEAALHIKDDEIRRLKIENNKLKQREKKIG